MDKVRERLIFKLCETVLDLPYWLSNTNEYVKMRLGKPLEDISNADIDYLIKTIRKDVCYEIAVSNDGIADDNYITG